MKRIMSVFLALVICIAGLTVPAAAAPKIKATRSYKDGYTYVTLTCPGCTLYYTTDGSKPDTTDKKYAKKLKFTEPTTLRVAAYKNGSRKATLKAQIAVRVKSPTIEFLGNDRDYSLYYVTVPDGATVYATTDGSTPSKTNGSKLKGSAPIEFEGSGEIKLVAYKNGWKKSKLRTVKVEVEEVLPDNEFAAEVLRLVNIERKKEGLSELKCDETLQKAAQARADEIVTYYSHTRPDGSDCFTILDEYNYRTWACAENIAAGLTTPAAVVGGWMNSSGHRANILGDYKYLGVGISYGGDYGTYWAQIFSA